MLLKSPKKQSTAIFQKGNGEKFIFSADRAIIVVRHFCRAGVAENNGSYSASLTQGLDIPPGCLLSVALRLYRP